MKAQLATKYHTFFRRLISCEIPVGEEGITVGGTRMGELDDFVDKLMEDWTNQADKDIAPFLPTLPPAKQLAFLQDRFCTYSEFEQLHTARRQNQPWDAIVFRLLAVNDAGQQNIYQRRYPPNREGYFKLMEVLQPQLRTFFFPTVQSLYPAC